MMGHSHAVSGALAFAGLGPVVAQVSGQSLSPAQFVAGTLACAGAAILPDIDHPQATIAHTLGPVTHGIAKLVQLLAGGHRQGTHTLLFALGMAGFMGVLTLGGDSGAWAALWVLCAFAFKALGLAPKRIGILGGGLSIVVSTTATLWLLGQHLGSGDWWWLVFAAGFGTFMHMVGDMLTPEGVPWFMGMFFMPARLRRTRFSVPVITRTGNLMETAVITPVMSLALLWFIWLNLRASIPDVPFPGG